MRSHLLDDANFDLAIVHVPDVLQQQAPLEAKGGQQQVDAHTAESIALQEGHQEAKADEDHHMDILKHCETAGMIGENWWESNITGKINAKHKTCNIKM